MLRRRSFDGVRARPVWVWSLANPPGWRLVPFALLLMALLLVVFIALARQVSDEVNRLGTSRTDNAYWMLTQMEVEFLELSAAVTRAQARPEMPLTGVRQRYDIVFSRVATLEESPIYRDALHASGSLPQALMLSQALRGLAPLFDGPDAALRAALPEIDASLTRWRPDLRAVAVQSNLQLARATASGRELVAGTMFRLAMVTLALVVVLGALAVGFFWVSQIARTKTGQVRRASLRLETIVSTAPDGLIVTGADGRVEAANPAAVALLGRAARDIIGRDIGTLLTRRDTGAALELPAASAGPQRIEVTALRGDGQSIPADLAVARAARDAGPDQPAIAVLFLRDISDRIAADDRLRQSRDQAMAGERAKAHFIAVMSHEMRTPLNAILGLSELLAEAPLPAPQQDQVALLDRSGRVLLQHVNDVLDIARLEARGAALVARPFELAALLRDLVDSLLAEAVARGNTLTLDIAPDAGGHFQGDAARLRQVLTNLLTNAVKYTRDGQVSLTVTAPPGPRPQVEFQVMDTGIGIAPERIEDVFVDFARLDTPGLTEDGTGLGLGIVRRLVDAMQGTLGVESEPGEGSLFWVRLPLDRVADAPLAEVVPPDGPVRPLRVLMAEDHAVNRLVLRRMLDRDGHDVTEVSDGAAALALAASHRFDAILMDIGMPRLDGLAATAAIRAGQGASAAARIVAVTAHAFPEDRARFLASGFDEVIAKPVGGAALRRALAGAGATVDPGRGLAAAPAFDAAHLASLQDLIGADAARAALTGLVMDASALAADLRAGAATPEALHRLAGLAGTCGAARLAAALAEAEARAGLPLDTAGLLHNIDATIAAASAQI